MFRSFQRLLLGLILIAGAAVILLLSDLDSRVDAFAGPNPAAAVGDAGSPNPSGKKWKIAVVMYSETPPAEETLEGMDDAWKRSKLVRGKDYEISLRSAQGDMASLNGIFDAVLTERADIVVPLSTPSLQTAVQKIRAIPIVFSLVANPMAAGAGKSYEEHLPNVTGVAVLGPAADMLDLLEKHYPKYKRLGTLFCPSETNSVDLKESFEKQCIKRGFTLEAVPVNTSADLSDAAFSLVSRPIDAVVQISDNLTSGGFSAITKAAREAKKPLISLNSTTVPLGAAVAMGRDYHYAGEVTVEMLEQVIAGKDLATMPFVLPPKVMRTASLPNAAAVGMQIPEALLKECDRVIK